MFVTFDPKVKWGRTISQNNAETMLISNLYLINEFRAVLISKHYNQFLSYTVTKFNMQYSIWKIVTNNTFFEALTDYQVKQRFLF